ncbi:uncharacterized protein LOC124156114 [Ischnura elegans]|uniref:uncharacterized protein LOC124156114 n=1 Tax=Ischnura elegans TaxID=197161 RepID=UPI001ED898DF|nr:uncharacterized protein LOC124156114 [Ischnura elegans]
MMVISTSTLAEVVEGIHENLKEFNLDIKYLIKLHEIFSSSRQGPEEGSVLKNIFEVIVHIYESQVDISGDRDIQCHLLVGECYDYLLNVLKKNSTQNNDLCLKAIDVLIVVTKRQSQSFKIIFKFVSHALLDIITCTQINITDRKEFMKALNFVLENTERNLRYKYRNDLKLESLSKLLYTCGDYETQANLIETLFRYTSAEERKNLARRWLNNNTEIIAQLLSIKDFEPDCRKFLIKFNRSLKDDSLVFSMPCLKAVIGCCELEKPEDPNCEEFWIDFNLGSSSVSIVCSQESLYSKAIYGSQITPGFWETLNVESQSVSKVSLQDVTGTVNEGAFEICLTLLQPCNIVFSCPSNFEGNMVVITFSMQHLKKIQMLIERLFPKNWSFNVKNIPSPKKKKSSFAQLSQESVQSIISSETKLKSSFVEKSEGKPISAKKPSEQLNKDLLDRSTSYSSKQQGLRSEEDKSIELMKSGRKSPYRPKSPFRPLEIIISPSCHNKGRIRQQPSGKSQLQTPQVNSPKKTESNISGMSLHSLDTGFNSMGTPQSGSFNSEEKGTEYINKVHSAVNMSPLHSHRKILKKSGEGIESSRNKKQIPGNAGNDNCENSHCSEVISERVLRSRKRLTLKSDVNEKTQEAAFNAGKRNNQSQEIHTSSTKMIKCINMADEPTGKQKKTSSEYNSVKMSKNSPGMNEGNSSPSNSKHPMSAIYDSSDDESAASSWMKFVRSAQKNKLSSTDKGISNKLPNTSTMPDNNFDKCRINKKSHQGSQTGKVEQKNSQKDADVEVEGRKNNCMQSREPNKRLSTRKKLFNSSENSLLAPLEQRLEDMKDAACKPSQASKPKFFSERNRKTLDPSMSILRNWSSGTESELSWLTQNQASKSSLQKKAMHSYQRCKNTGRKLGERLNHTVKNLIEKSNEEEVRMHEKMTINKSGRNLRVGAGKRAFHEDVSDNSSDEDYVINGKPKKSNKRDLTSSKIQEKRANCKRNTIGTPREMSEIEQSPPQHDFEVQREKSLRNENLNNSSCQKKTLSEEKASHDKRVNSFSNAPIMEEKVESYEINHNSDKAVSSGRVANSESHQLICFDKGIAYESTSFNSPPKSSEKQDANHQVTGFQNISHSHIINESDSNNSHLQTTGKKSTEGSTKTDDAILKTLETQLARWTSPKNGGASSDSQTYIHEKEMQEQTVKEMGASNTHGNMMKGITNSKARKTDCEAARSQILTNMDNQCHNMQKNMHGITPHMESPLGATNKNTTRKKRCTDSGTEVSPDWKNQTRNMEKSKHNKLLVKEPAIDCIHECINQAKNDRNSYSINDENFSPDMETSRDSKSEVSSSDVDDEDYIPPSLVEETTVLPINKSFPGRESGFSIKNVTTRRGSHFDSQPDEQWRKKMKFSSNKMFLNAYQDLGNTENLSLNDATVISQGHKRAHQDKMNKTSSGHSFSADSIPKKKFRELDEKLQTLPEEKEVPQRLPPEKPVRTSNEEMELEKLMSEFDATINKTARKKVDKVFDLMETSERSEYTMTTDKNDLIISSGHEKKCSKAISRKRNDSDLGLCTKRPSTLRNSMVDKQSNKRKTFPHLIQGTSREDNFQDDKCNSSEDSILDLSRTVEQLFKKHTAMKMESFNDMRQRLLKLTAEAANEFQLEYGRKIEIGDIEGLIQNLQQSLEKENSLIKRLDKCYKYLYNTSIMRSQNSKEIKKSLEEITKLMDENVSSLSKLDKNKIHDKYNEILSSKTAKLKETFFQLDQKKEMVKNLHYIKSFMLH